MKKIPKHIVEKIELRNKLNKEIDKWCKNHLDMEGMDSEHADIVKHPTGQEQGYEWCKEWCEQHEIYEDCYIGEYYWETEIEGKYLHMHFEI